MAVLSQGVCVCVRACVCVPMWFKELEDRGCTWPLANPGFCSWEKDIMNRQFPIWRFAEIQEQRCSDLVWTLGEEGASHGLVGSQRGGTLWSAGRVS